MKQDNNTFRNTEMLNWMGFFSEKLDVSPEKIHPMNLCGRKKNVRHFVLNVDKVSVH